MNVLTRIEYELTEHPLLAMLFGVGLAFVIVGLAVGFIGLVYGFEETAEMQNETMLMPYCRNLDEVWVPVLNTTCSFFYGGPVD